MNIKEYFLSLSLFACCTVADEKEKKILIVFASMQSNNSERSRFELMRIIE
jgi:hypothetical protein